MSFLTLTESRDLLDKCKFELSLLTACKSNPECEYHAFNLVVGLNHLFEWAFKEGDFERKVSCFARFNPFQDEVSRDFKEVLSVFKEPCKVNPYQMTIRQLCNGAKHFKKKANYQSKRNVTAVMGSLHMGSEVAAMGAFSHYSYLVDIDGTDVEILELLKVQVEAWSDFFESNV